MSPLHKPKFGPGEIIILFVMGVLSLIIATGNARRVFDALFTPTAIVIVVIMLFEYLLLKGADRSDIYRRELDAARQKRRDDLLALHEMETRLIELNTRLDQALEVGETVQAAELRAELAAARDAARQVHSKLRERI